MRAYLHGSVAGENRMKVCTKCGLEKPLTEFHKQRLGRSGKFARCKACRRAERMELYAANPEPIKAASRQWRAANLEKARVRDRRLYAANPERHRAKAKAQYAADPEKSKAANKKWCASHPERARDRYAADPAKAQAYVAWRNAQDIRATPAWANYFFIEEIYGLATRRTKLKTGGVPRWEVDHIVPIRSKFVCGLHVENNMRVVPRSENRRKGNRLWPDMP